MVIRGCRVLLDTDLARLYGVEVKVLNQAVKRNLARFPGDFAFQLQAEESRPLRSQFVTLEPGRGRHRTPETVSIDCTCHPDGVETVPAGCRMSSSVLVQPIPGGDAPSHRW